MEEPTNSGDSLGNLIRVFKPDFAVLYLLMALGILLILFGISFSIFCIIRIFIPDFMIDGEAHWWQLALLSFVGLVPIFFGWIFYLMGANNKDVVIEVHEGGLLMLEKKERKTIYWRNIKSVDTVLVSPANKVVYSSAIDLMASTIRSRFLVMNLRNSKITLNENSLKQLGKFIKELKKHADKNGIPWNDLEMDDIAFERHLS